MPPTHYDFEETFIRTDRGGRDNQRWRSERSTRKSRPLELLMSKILLSMIMVRPRVDG
jgi:hypothetical protein